MWVYVPKKVCRHCGKKDTAFFAQKQRKTQFTISNKCFECKSKERSIYYYQNDKFKRYLAWKKKTE